MGQKVNPISNRLGIVRGWDSNWFGGKSYGDTILEDSQIRKYLNARLGDASISRIVIERTLKMVTITVCTARPGLIIGKGGEKVDKLKEELRARHIHRMQQGSCSIEAGFIWSDLLTNLERVTDHCSNIACCLAELSHRSMDMHSYTRNLRRNDGDFAALCAEYAKKYALEEK